MQIVQWKGSDGSCSSKYAEDAILGRSAAVTASNTARDRARLKSQGAAACEVRPAPVELAAGAPLASTRTKRSAKKLS